MKKKKWFNIFQKIISENEEVIVPAVLQFQHTTIISWNKCKRSLNLLNDQMLCTTNSMGKGVCYGDSGGPLSSLENQLIGIVSWGKGCAIGIPDVYTNVYSYTNWIQTVMASK